MGKLFDWTPALEIGAWDTVLGLCPYLKICGCEYPVILSEDMPIDTWGFIDAEGNLVTVEEEDE